MVIEFASAIIAVGSSQYHPFLDQFVSVAAISRFVAGLP